MADSFFLRHESCPRCGSKDNLGVWSDGHKWCFGCHYYEASPESIETYKTRMEHFTNHDIEAPELDTSDFHPAIPDEALAWLRKYGISDTEIKHYELCWNRKTSSLVFPVFNSRKKLVYYQERYFGPDKDKPKYITRGSKTQQLMYIINNNFPKTLVLVEDYVSAIKVSRYCSASPLLGSNISSRASKWVAERFNRVRLWLDMDKAVESLREASRLPVNDVRVVLTPLDPKEYSTGEIVKILVEYGLKLN